MIKPDHYFELEFDARPENESFGRQCVSTFLLRFDPTFSDLADLRTAVSEAVTNSVVHAYGNRGEGKVYIGVRSYGRRIVIRVKDEGCGMEDPEKCRAPLFTTDTTGERGGMGFAIMESFTDKMKIKTEVGKGTTVTLIKTLA